MTSVSKETQDTVTCDNGETHIHLRHQHKEGNITKPENKDEDIMKMMVVVSVRERGKGMDPDILPRLVTKFTTKSDRGTGLGLYIAEHH